ncbi:MAG: tetratricopeptide repeat protein [Acidobacteriota bacterium]|nr:tetratricopeptide repeat protein [Blastocatellia bacterium]MDW8413420.1 tetratricopeptide repeat protein [Acidobacteriota bacterium]
MRLSATILTVLVASITVCSQEISVATQPAIDPARKQEAYREYLKAREYELENNFIQALKSYKRVIELDPSSPEPHVALGEFYARNRNTKDAENEARQAIAISKDSLGAHRLLGRIMASEGISSGNKEKMLEATVHFLEVVRLDKQDAEAWRFLGTLYAMTNDQDRALDAYQRLISTGFASFADYYEIARINYSKGNYREAANAARQSFERSDENPQVGFLLADSLMRIGQTAEAISVFQQILHQNPSNLSLLLGYSEALSRAGRYEEAIKQLKQILETNPKNLRALNLLAQTQRRAGRREEAIVTLKQALAGQDVSDSLELQFELAEVYDELGQLENAIAAYEEALAAVLNPDGSVSDSNKRNAGVIFQAMVFAYRNAAKINKALQVIERMRKTLGKDSTLPDILLIDTLRAEGRYSEALEAARKAQKAFPKERQFKYLEAQILGQVGKVDFAAELLKSMLDGSDQDGDVYHYLSFIMLDDNRFAEAEQYVRKALLFDEKNISYLITLSSIQDRAKNYEDSERTLRLVLKLDPDNATALNNLGYFLTERGERLSEALELIQRAINIDPMNSSFIDSLGWVYFKLGDLDKAVIYLEQAINLDPRSATSHDHLGDVYFKLGRTSEAIKMWQEALKMSRDSEEISKIKEKLKEHKR